MCVHVHEKMAAAMNLYPAAGAVGDGRGSTTPLVP